MVWKAETIFTKSSLGGNEKQSVNLNIDGSFVFLEFISHSPPGGLLSQDVSVLNHKVPEAASLLLRPVLEGAVREQRSSKLDLNVQERGGEPVRGQTLIHIPVELWVGNR